MDNEDRVKQVSAPEGGNFSNQISPEKLQANRKNAKRSTGPRTPRGKRNSSRNALKHGILSNDLLVGHGTGRENRREYQALLAELIEDLQPVGRTEELLVERIVGCDWRYRRSLRAEAGEIAIGFLEEERHSLRVTDPNLPGPEATENILRYQSAILKQRSRAMAELEERQRRRQQKPSPDHPRADSQD